MDEERELTSLLRCLCWLQLMGESFSQREKVARRAGGGDQFSRTLCPTRPSKTDLMIGCIVDNLDGSPKTYLEPLVPQEFSGDLKIALLIRVRHVRPIHPLSGPLHRTGEIHGIFDHAGIDQAFAIGTKGKAFSQFLPRAARQRIGKTHRMLLEIRRLHDQSLPFPSPHGMPVEGCLTGRRMLASVEIDRAF